MDTTQERKMRISNSDLTVTSAKTIHRRTLRHFAEWYLSRPYSGKAKRRICIYHETNHISMAQIYPFLHYHKRFEALHGIQIRCMPVSSMLTQGKIREADISLVQCWFDVDKNNLRRSVERLRSYSQVVGFIDTFAHNDLRLAVHLHPYIDLYFKKSLFRDRDLYYTPFQGDTNLTQYYQQLYKIPGKVVDWRVPERFTDLLRLSPNFFTSPNLLHAFEDTNLPDHADKTIDLHARLGLGSDNGGWYRRMREDALTRAEALSPHIRVVAQGNVDKKLYMAELWASKLCFSPFGFGELCWRDIEAILAGAVLIKPDMSHLETLPDLYEPGVTYLPVRWDFADLKDVVQSALADSTLRRQITEVARSRVVAYLQEGRFVQDVAKALNDRMI